MKKSYISAVAMVLVVAAWIASGQFVGTEAAAEGEAGAKPDAGAAKPAERLTVRARVSVAQPRAGEVSLRGRTEALRTVRLMSETEGRVVDVPVEKGAMVRAGTVICRLATDDRAAALAEAKATLRQRELEQAAATQLSTKGFVSQTRAAEAAAQLDGARAMVSRMEVELARAEIRAPFDGIVEERPAEIGALLMKGGECAALVDSDPMLVVGQVAERDVGLIHVGDAGQARLVDGTKVEGRVRFVGKTAQATTRTFRVELEVPNPDARLKSGLSADIALPTPPQPAHLVSPAVLTLDDSGRVGVRTLDADNVVGFVPVTPVASTAEGMWITGLPERATLITVGQEYVKAGEKVDVALEGPQS
jgi:multidrug efflux system membrane fusion protein